MRIFLLVGVIAALAATEVGLASSGAAWKVIKRGTPASAGELAIVGTIVMHPKRVAVRARVANAKAISLLVVMSCRKGIKTGVVRRRVSGVAPYTKALQLPITGADNCAVSATGTNSNGVLALDLLHST